MNLKNLIEGMEVLSVCGGLDVEVSGVSYDSRKVFPGDVFVAVRGIKSDGREFIGEALRKGASAVVLEGDCRGVGATALWVRDSRAALARLSANFFGRPSERLVVAGVTGTNGKTTTTYLMKSCLEASGRKAGVIGTINYVIGDSIRPAPHTTPEALEFQGLLSEMLSSGISHAVVEVSSHALSLKRVDGTGFDAAVFTNLTREHLDFHVDMEGYFEAKKRLFAELLKDDGVAVINTDDPYGRRLVDELRMRGGRSLNVVTCGLEGSADFKASEAEESYDGVSLVISHGGKRHEIASPLMGAANIHNILSASAACFSMGVEWEFITEGARKVKTVSGRFEKVDLGQKFLCIIDYAHTTDALERLMRSARRLSSGTGGRVLTVFGCGGDRDRGKRPEMGRAASELSDMVFVTSDNPRGEDPLEIIKDITSGISGGNCEVVPDREEAVRRAVMAAEPSDIVLVAGKGHEEYQEIKGERHRLSDREAAEKAIAFKLKKGESI